MTQQPQLPTRGQLERQLSQRIQAFYRQQLGHQPSKVTCQIFDAKVALLLDDSITPSEQRLVENQQMSLAKQVRADLNEALAPRLRALIEEILGIPVVDLLCDAALETGRAGVIAVLARSPQVRPPRSISKTKPSSSET